MLTKCFNKIRSLIQPAIHLTHPTVKAFTPSKKFSFDLSEGQKRMPFHHDCHPCLLAVILAVTCLTYPALAAPGDLDPTFANAGKLRHPVATSTLPDFAASVVVQSDGKIVIAGTMQKEDGDDDFALLRLHPDGSIDKTFGTDGKVVLDIRNDINRATGLALQSDGKLVICGTTGNGSFGAKNNDFTVARFNSNGALDLSFASDGFVLIDFGTYSSGGSTYNRSDTCNSLAIQSDGKIILVGSSTAGAEVDFAIARLHATGSLDGTFGGGGLVRTDISTDSQDSAYAVAVQADEKIVVVGNAWGATRPWAVARYTSSGALDSTFGSGGKLTTILGSSGNDTAHAVVIQPDGRIVVGGESYMGSRYDFSLARYLENGTLDTSFNGTGKVLTNVASNQYIRGLALQTNGKIVAAGGVSYPGGAYSSNFGFARYLPNGSLDNTFSDDGREVIRVGLDEGTAEDLVLQTDGKIIAVGKGNNRSSPPRNDDFGVVRLEGDPIAPELSVESPPDTPLAEFATIDFGYVGVGTTGRKTLTIRNTGSAPLTGLEVSKYGADAALFAVSALSTTSLQPNGTATVTLQFTPTSVVAANAVLTVRSGNTTANPFDVRLTGNNISVTANPGKIQSSFIGPLRSTTETVSTGVNPYASTIPLTLSSSVSWLLIGSPNQSIPAAQATSNWPPGSAATFNLAIDMAGLALGTYQTTLTGQPGNWSVNVTVQNAQVFNPRVVFEGTGEPVSKVRFEVRRPDNNYFIMYSGDDGYPNPLQTVVQEGQYEIWVSKPSFPFPAQPSKFATVSVSSALFPVFEVPGPPSVEQASGLPPGSLIRSGGSLPWFGQTLVSHDGVDAAQSGAITHNEESWFETTITGPGSLSFWWILSSQADADYLEFYINGVLQPGRISGNPPWQQLSFSLGRGNHTLRWRYVKDGSHSDYSDAGWVDEIVWAPQMYTFSSWQSAFFTPSQLADPLISGPDADPDLDGLKNLMEFAFDLDPLLPDAARLPRPQTIGDRFVVSFTEPLRIAGIRYGAMWSPSLAPESWQTVPDTGSGPVHTFSVPIGTHSNLFMYLTITSP